jgi:hypothetical protein
MISLLGRLRFRRNLLFPDWNYFSHPGFLTRVANRNDLVIPSEYVGLDRDLPLGLILAKKAEFSFFMGPTPSRVFSAIADSRVFIEFAHCFLFRELVLSSATLDNVPS